MAHRTPLRALSSAVLFALVLTTLFPQPAFADEGTPPPGDPAPAEVEATPGAVPADTAGDPPASEATAAETPGPAELAAIPEDGALPASDPAPAPDDSAGSDGVAADPDGLPEVLAALPDGTTIAVVDTQGEAISLVSDQAQAIVASGDPIWCPASIKAPTPNLNGCTPSRTSFFELLTDLAALSTPADGIIWIAASYDSIAAGDGALISIDGSSLINLRDFKLTLRGGWSGAAGDKTITPADPDDLLPDTTFNGTQVQIASWRNDVTLTDLVIMNSPGTGLHVSTTGAISATRLFAHDNAGTGIRLDNTAATSAKAVSVSDSRSNANAGFGGMYVLSNGKITLANVIASDNTLPSNSTGAYLDNTSALTPQPIVLSGLSTFNNNADSGLEVHSLGAITANDLTASGNDQWGAWLTNDGVGGEGAVTLTGTNIFTENYLGGLNIASAGAIKLNNLIADSNNTGIGLGAQLINTGADPDQPVVLTGSSSFKYNMYLGLYIAARGPVTLNNITASGNLSDSGLSISTSSSSSAGVTLTGTNTFNDNYDDGLNIYSNGLIKLNSVTALGNGFGSGNGYGIAAYNSGSTSRPGITLTGTHNLSGNRSSGLYLRTRGPAAISNLTASDNDGHGADLDNTSSGTDSPQKVTLSGKNLFGGNANNGLLVYSYGAITASSLTATGNGLAGSGNPGVYIYNTSGDTAQPVTLTGANLFTGNGRTGLEVQSLGAIKVSSLTASGNGAGGILGHGAYLNNSSATSPGAGISLSGTNALSDNYSSGLRAYSLGPIALANLIASGNGEAGVEAGSGTASHPQKMSVTGTGAFDNNDGYGLSLSGYGAVTLASLSASGNGGYGVYIYNAVGTSAQPVTLSGSFLLNDNAATGLYIQSYGAVTAGNLAVVGNGADGVWVSNDYTDMTGGITLAGKNVVSDNYYGGLGLASHGPITISNLTANGNGIGGSSGSGADISNSGASTAQKITFTGTSTFHGNYGYGLNLIAAGPVSLSNVSANDSVIAAGLRLLNTTAYAGPVTLTGVSTFSGNHATGLDILSHGAINLNTTRLEASGNGVTTGSGVSLNNTGAASPQNVTQKGSLSAVGNYGDGLSIHSKGAIALNNLTSSGTANGRGAELSNAFPNAVGGVTLSGSSVFQDNAYQGLAISSYGPVCLSSLTATGNGFGASYGAGVDVANPTDPATPQPVKLTGVSNLSGNYAGGLTVASNGAITVSNLTASDTDGYGAYLYNAYSGSVGGITLTGTNVFNNNRYSGVEAFSRGPISVNNLTANDNGIVGMSGVGALLHNSTSGSVGGITLTGSNTFNANYMDGLTVSSLGAISASNLTARGNSLGTGASFNNFNGGEGVGVSLSGTNVFAENSTIGLSITSAGLVSATRVSADGNGSTGMRVYNNVAGVTVTCGSFISNPIFAIYVSTAGVLRLAGVVASDEIGWSGGATLDIARACPLG